MVVVVDWIEMAAAAAVVPMRSRRWRGRVKGVTSFAGLWKWETSEIGYRCSKYQPFNKFPSIMYRCGCVASHGHSVSIIPYPGRPFPINPFAAVHTGIVFPTRQSVVLIVRRRQPVRPSKRHSLLIRWRMFPWPPFKLCKKVSFRTTNRREKCIRRWW